MCLIRALGYIRGISVTTDDILKAYCSSTQKAPVATRVRIAPEHPLPVCKDLTTLCDFDLATGCNTFRQFVEVRFSILKSVLESSKGNNLF